MLVTRDLRTLIYLLNLELREERHWAGNRMRGAAVEADAIGEQQPKRTRSGAAAGADASGERAAAAEAGAIGSSSCNRDIEHLIRSGRKRRAAAEVDAIRGRVASRRNRGGAALHRELSGARLLTR